MKKKLKAKPIKWNPKEMWLSKIKPTPNNFKIKNALGKERLSISMFLFGNASTVVVNTDGRLIDGNSRVEEERKINKGKDVKMWVMWPSRTLTAKEYKEFSAMFDYAQAGDVDVDRIKGELGKTADFYTSWKMEVPMRLLNKMGKKGSPRDLSSLQYPKGATKETESGQAENSMMVQLFFTTSEEEKFRLMEEKIQRKYKTSDTTQTAIKAFQIASKGLK